MIPKWNHLRRWLTREKRVKWAWCFCIIVFLVIFIDSFGVVRLYYERDFDSEFKYPLEVSDFPDLVRKFRNGDPVDQQPINIKYSTPNFIRKASSGCPGPHDLLIMVKSAPAYFENRAAIRATWGDPSYLQSIPNTLIRFGGEKSFSSPEMKSRLLVSTSSTATMYNNKSKRMTNFQGLSENQNSSVPSSQSKLARPHLSIKLVFLLGIVNSMSQKSQETLAEEMAMYDDIVQVDYLDSYENNTIKAIVALRWAKEVCPEFKFATLIDDDMYISIKNLVRFIENPTSYPKDLNAPKMLSPNKNTLNDEEAEFTDESQLESVNQEKLSSPTTATEEENVKLYGGRVLIVRPKRYKSSKWYLPLEEYPYNYFPPYVPAATVVMSKSTLLDFYYASYFTHHFRFDDVFLGILAYKMKIRPMNSNYFHVCHDVGGKCTSDIGDPVNQTEESYDESSSSSSSHHIIAMHGLSSPEELREYWNLQKDIGNV